MCASIEFCSVNPHQSRGFVLFLEHLFHHLVAHTPAWHWSVFLPAGFHLPDDIAPRAERITLPTDSVWSALDAQLADRRCDVLLRSQPVAEPLAFPTGRQVILIPDLHHADHPEHFSAAELDQRRRAFDLCLGQEGTVLLLSRHTRNRLAHHYPRCPARLAYIPLPAPWTDALLTESSETDFVTDAAAWKASADAVSFAMGDLIRQAPRHADALAAIRVMTDRLVTGPVPRQQMSLRLALAPGDYSIKLKVGQVALDELCFEWNGREVPAGSVRYESGAICFEVDGHWCRGEAMQDLIILRREQACTDNGEWSLPVFGVEIEPLAGCEVILAAA